MLYTQVSTNIECGLPLKLLIIKLEHRWNGEILCSCFYTVNPEMYKNKIKPNMTESCIIHVHVLAEKIHTVHKFLIGISERLGILGRFGADKPDWCENLGEHARELMMLLLIILQINVFIHSI